MGKRNQPKEIEKVKTLLGTDPDYIFSSKYGFSLKNVLVKYPNGCPNKIIASSLMIKEEDVEKLYATIVTKLQNHLKVKIT